MWTPKRILILLGGLALFLTGFGVYTYFLGGIDGLPPLGDEFLPDPNGRVIRETTKYPAITIDRKLVWAFGLECPELQRSIKLDLSQKGWGIAAGEFENLPDGRIKLFPFSAFLAPNKQVADKIPEINTLRCDEAYLTLDRPVSTTTEIGNRKLIAVELRGKSGITIKNNRGTLEENDDIELFIPDSPLFFEDKRNLIWTDGPIQLLDKQSRPHPTKITARRMELNLTKEPEAQAEGKPKTNGTGVTGVDSLVLGSNVDMHLWVDATSGFLGNDGSFSTKQPSDAEKSHVFVKTAGKFVYDLRKEMAHFYSPEGSSNAGMPEEVLVMREHRIGEGKAKRETAPGKPGDPLPTLYDQLVCHHLELQFRRKAADKSAPKPANDASHAKGDKEIDWARATALPGKDITLTMDTENLEVTGSELMFYSPTADSGPQTIIKGKPLKASKEGHIIIARELMLAGANKEGKGQRAYAKGPGQIDIYDKGKSTPDQPLYPRHAFWKDTLTSTKDEVGGKMYDLLTFSGDAALVDDEQQQQMHAQKIQIWLLPGDSKTKDGTEPTGQMQTFSGQKPAKIDAFENVFISAPEIKVRKTDHLLVHFDENGLAMEQLPDTSRVKTGTELTVPQPIGSVPASLEKAGSDPGNAKTSPPSTLPGDPSADSPARRLKDRKPIEMDARQVVVYVSRFGSRNHIREVVSEGNVRVQQEPANPKDKGVDVKGEMLNLLHHPLGDTLHVFGDSRRPSQLQLGELILIGPKVTINQRDNIAEVDGIGAMQLPSNTTFKGEKPAKEATRLTIHWNKNMLFDGKYAHFHGGVVAYQDKASLRCQDLQVTLDHVVSFKEGEKGGQNAKVDIMICDRKVFIVDEKQDEKGLRIGYQRLEATQVRLDNPAEQVNTSGPGRVIAWQKGSMDHLAPAPKSSPTAVKPAPAPADTEQFQLTRIDYFGSMSSTTKDNIRTSTFYDNVEVFHAPADRPDMEVNPDHPPKNGFYLRCDMLRVYTKSVSKDKTMQYMRADRKVFFRTLGFYGRADVVKFDQGQEIVIFEGAPGNPATLYQDQGAGIDPRQIQGMKILYNRRTGEFSLEGGNNIQ